MDEVIERHRAACNGFGRVAHAVPAAAWTAPTPCPDWDARAVVEHAIGFHEVLLLRPAGVRAHRPREGAAARWDATNAAIFTALAADPAFDRNLIGALTTDMLVHTWDLAVATGVDPALDAAACERALAHAYAAGFARGDMIGPEFSVDATADSATRLVAFYGRDPAWRARS
jgi:uncharacterized protein (TIGR03086 family)